MKNIFYYETKLGKIGIAEDGKGITDLYISGETIIRRYEY